MAVFLVGCGQDIEQNQADMSGEVPVAEDSSLSEKAEEENEEEPAKDVAETEESSSPEDAVENSSGPLDELKVHYIDVGQADAALFQYSDGEDSYTILFDTGDWRGNDVVNYLAAQNVSDIDLIVVSHPDADHIGQLAEIVSTYETGEVWLSGNESSSKTFQNAIEAVINSDADYHEPRMGEEFAIGPMEIDVLYPRNISGKANEESISLKFTYGDVRFIFTGDAEKSGEQEMIQSGMKLDADILQLGHHGSKTSSSSSFIDAVNPSVAIYSAGENNSYGHPSAEVVSLIQDKGMELYGTDVHGTIVVTTDGKEFSIATKEDGTISPKSSGASSESTSSGDSSSSTSESDSSNTTSNEKSENSGSASAGSCININEASVEELQNIIHIGPARAEELIQLRPFKSVDDLSRINGIGPARIDDIKNEGLAC